MRDTFVCVTTLQELLVRSSRTFAVGIDLLPPPLREEVTVAYLLLRVSDYLEDNQELGNDDKVGLLKEWRSVLDGQGDRATFAGRLEDAREATPDALVARHASTVLDGLDGLAPEARDILVRRVRESSAGMARWTERGSVFRNEADLDDYMHEVAGRVGYLLTELFALRLRLRGDRARMMELGREFGLALQTVNVIRGLHEDRDRGWVYVPAAFLPDPRIRPGELFDPANRKAAMAVLDRLVRKADRHLAAARAYIRLIPRPNHRVRLFCLLPLLFAVRTLAISRANPKVLKRETKMTRREVEVITRRAKVWGFSNGWIEWYCRRLETRGA